MPTRYHEPVTCYFLFDDFCVSLDQQAICSAYRFLILDHYKEALAHFKSAMFKFLEVLLSTLAPFLESMANSLWVKKWSVR